MREARDTSEDDPALSEEADLADAYTRARPRLVRVAYAVTGSLADAEDVSRILFRFFVQGQMEAFCKQVLQHHGNVFF